MKFKRRRIVAAVLLGTILLTVVGVRVVPRLMVVAFVKQARSNSLDQAYRLTSKAFQGHVSKDDFPEYVSGLDLTDTEYRFTGKSLIIGRDCDQKRRLLLNVRACKEGERPLSLIFVWEAGGWKFDCVSLR